MKRAAQINLAMLLGSLLIVGPGLFLALGSSQHTMTANAEVTLPIETSYEEVRTRLVRQDPTEAIFDDGELELLGVETVTRVVDLSSDKNPILNALRRRSQSTIKCVRRLEACADRVDPTLSHIVLRQRSLISPRGTQIKTELDSEEECLKAYAVDLKITPNETGCTLKMVMRVKYCKSLSPLSRLFADEYVQAKITESCNRQAVGIINHLQLDAAASRNLVAQH